VRPFVGLLLALAILVAGCAGDKSEGGAGDGLPTDATPTTTRGGNNTSAPLPPEPHEIFNDTFQYRNGGNGGSKSMSVLPRGTQIEYRLVLRAAGGPALVQGEPNGGDPAIEFRPPTGQTFRQTFNPVPQATPSPGQELARYSGRIPNPQEGDWTIVSRGMGHNIDAHVAVVELVRPVAS
jgi:hypothetical protein